MPSAAPWCTRGTENGPEAQSSNRWVFDKLKHTKSWLDLDYRMTCSSEFRKDTIVNPTVYKADSLHIPLSEPSFRLQRFARISIYIMERFHISATGHSLNYLPEYIAQRHNLFAEQGLNVSVSVPSPWDLVLEELANKTASAALGGIWVPSMFRNRVKNYTAFAQVANRCPLAILKRGSATGFELFEVIGRTVLMKSCNGASVGLFVKMFLRKSGIDPNEVHFVQDLDGKMLANLFEGGMGGLFRCGQCHGSYNGP